MLRKILGSRPKLTVCRWDDAATGEGEE